MGRRIPGECVDVTGINDEPDTVLGDQESASDPKEGETTSNEATTEIEILPTLTGYFEESRASPTAFFKVLRKNNVRRFRSSDQEAAAKLMISLDPEGKRLWALMSQSSLPNAVDTWIWVATQDRLKEQLGDSFDPEDRNAKRVFTSILTNLSPGLRSERKEDNRRVEAWLRIGICWLMERRSLKAWSIADGLRPILFSELKLASRLAYRSIQKGKIGQLRLAVAIAGLGTETIKAAEQERDRERHGSTHLRQRLEEAQAAVARLQTELGDAKKKIIEHESTISESERTLSAERHHWGHDLTETKAKQKVLLGERLGPLLEDAVDALEIDPPAPSIALRRVKSALTIIREAKE